MADVSKDLATDDAAEAARPDGRYTGTAVALHAAVGMLVLLATGLALFREAFSGQAIWMISAHKVVGLCSLVVGSALLMWRLGHPPPAFPAQMRRREAAIARSVHRLLYILVIVVPLAGWTFVSFAPESRPLDYRGLNSVPQLPLADDGAKSVIWHEVHELLGFAMIGLLLVHMVGAVRHQRAGSALRERMLVSRPRWLRPLIFLAVLVWLLGLSLDLLGTRVT